MIRLGQGLLALGVLAWAEGANAQMAPTPPTKTITIYNNSRDHVIHPVIQAPIQFGAEVHDLWMQAQFDVKEADYLSRPFQTTKLYRAWINHDSGGIPPGGSVTITVPFYTQLKPWTQANAGQVEDQFIDWWNAMRVYVFDGKDAADAAYNFSQDNPAPGVPVKPVLPPYPITPMVGAAVPTCSAGCTLDLRSYYVGFPYGVPGQLVEYTFAAAEGPPNHDKFTINLTTVNYNISAVDSIYLPVAMGASGNRSASNTYLGSVQSVTSFRAALNEFALQGGLWPDFIPGYYLPSNSIIAIPSPDGPPNGIKAYPEPQVPSANFMYAESYRVPAPAPPTLTSDADPPWVKQKAYGQLGDLGQATLDLWNKCTTGGASSKTCTQIQSIRDFFDADYKVCFGVPPNLNDPSILHDFLRDVYGWAQFPGCKGSLADTLPHQYPVAVKTFCDLMYNFFTVADYSEVFNPYVKLIHVTLESNAYAFSIDDEQAFKSVQGTGVIITVAGENGLENTTQTELPTAANYSKFCQSGDKTRNLSKQ
jgi:hypothetical protein